MWQHGADKKLVSIGIEVNYMKTYKDNIKTCSVITYATIGP